MQINSVYFIKNDMNNFGKNCGVKNNNFNRTIKQDKFELNNNSSVSIPVSFCGIKVRADKEPRDVYAYHCAYTVSSESMIDMDGCIIDMKDSKISNILKDVKTGNAIYIGTCPNKTVGRYIGNDAQNNNIFMTDKKNSQHLQILGIIKKTDKGYIYYDRSKFGSLLNPSKYLGKTKVNNFPKYTLTPKQKADYIRACKLFGLKPKDDEYAGFVLNNNYLQKNYYSQNGGFWRFPLPKANNDMCAWKMHVYSDNSSDYLKMAEILLPYLVYSGIEHKCMTEYRSPEDLPKVQKGKAFTIYPSGIEQMEKIAKDLDFIFKHQGLDKKSTKISGDRQLGNSGRLFYRYELDSGKYASIPINKELYDAHYESNRSNKSLEYPHLAADMKLSDDIWINFDPSNPDSHPAVKMPIEKLRLSKSQRVQINPNSSKIYLCSNSSEGFLLDLQSPDISKKIYSMKDGDTLTIGRIDCDIEIPEDYVYVSRKHGLISKVQNKFFYTDTSKNGTYIINKF